MPTGAEKEDWISDGLLSVNARREQGLSSQWTGNEFTSAPGPCISHLHSYNVVSLRSLVWCQRRSKRESGLSLSPSGNGTKYRALSTEIIWKTRIPTPARSVLEVLLTPGRFQPAVFPTFSLTNWPSLQFSMYLQ